MILIRKILFTLFFVLMGTHFITADAAIRTDKEVSLMSGSTSVELQKLLDLNKDNKYNLTIKIPKGTYILTNELRIYSNTTIKADKSAKMMKNHLRA